MLAIETDENQHKHYDEEDERIRYDDLVMVYTGKWIFIRYNPDKYMDSRGKRCNPQLATRLRRLGEEITHQIERITRGENTDLLEVVHLFYDV